MTRISRRPRSDCLVDAKAKTLRALFAGLGLAGWATAAMIAVQTTNLVQEKRDISIDLMHSRMAQANLARQIDDLMAQTVAVEPRLAGLED